MIDQSFLDLFANIDSKEGFYLWLFMLISFLLGFLIALLLRWSRIRRLKKELKAIKEKEESFDTTIAELEAKLNERNIELQEASREKVDLMDRFTEMDQQQQEHLTEVYKLNQKIEELQNTNRTYTTSIDDLNTQLIGLKAQNEELVDTTNPTQTYNSSSDSISQKAYNDMQERLNSVEETLTKLSSENNQLKNDLQVIKKKDNSTIASTEEDPKLQITTEKVVLYNKIIADDRHKDDLTKIEGLGEFTARKLNSIGVFTYEDIAQWDTQKIDEITTAIEYIPGRIQKDDWAGQATALLDGYTTTKSVATKKTKSTKKKATKKSAGDDLKIIEGIGPKIAEVLNNAGINSWATLAATEPGQLKEILKNAGGRFQMHSPYTWPLQARLAAAGRWDELNQYQDELKGGKE